MRKLLFATTAVLLMSGSAFAQGHRLPSGHGQAGVVEANKNNLSFIGERDGKRHYLNLSGTTWDQDRRVYKVNNAPFGDRFHPLDDPHWSRNQSAKEQNFMTASRPHFSKTETDRAVIYSFGRMSDTPKIIDHDGLPPIVEGDDDDEFFAPDPTHRSDLPPSELSASSEESYQALLAVANKLGYKTVSELQKNAPKHDSEDLAREYYNAKHANKAKAKSSSVKTEEVVAVSAEVSSDQQITQSLKTGQAILMAISGIPDAGKGDNTISVGTALGYMHGETAIAAGLNARLNDRVVVKTAVGADFALENIGATIGVGFSF